MAINIGGTLIVIGWLALYAAVLIVAISLDTDNTGLWALATVIYAIATGAALIKLGLPHVLSGSSNSPTPSMPSPSSPKSPAWGLAVIILIVAAVIGFKYLWPTIVAWLSQIITLLLMLAVPTVIMTCIVVVLRPGLSRTSDVIIGAIVGIPLAFLLISNSSGQ